MAKERIGAVIVENLYEMLKHKKPFSEDVFSRKMDKMIQREIGKNKNRSKRISELLNAARYYHNVAEEEKKAIKICDQILEEDSQNRDAMLIKAGALFHSGKPKESLELINGIKEKWPDHWEAYYLLGIHFFNEDETRAFEFLKKSLELDENFNNLTVIAQLSYFMGKLDYQDYLDKAKKLEPERFRSYMKNCWSYHL